MPDHRSHRGIWLGPLVAFAGVAGYFALFMRWTALNDVPWPSLLLLAVAVFVSTRAMRRAWPAGGALRRTGAASGLALSSLLATVFVYYCFFMTAALPEAARALPGGPSVPQVTLQDEANQAVDLAEVARGTTVLVFYRGFW